MSNPKLTYNQWTLSLLIYLRFVGVETYCYLQVIQSGLVSVWAFRLGIFLIFRMIRDGRDSRFSQFVKNDSKIFFVFWTVEGMLATVPAMYN